MKGPGRFFGLHVGAAGAIVVAVAGLGWAALSGLQERQGFPHSEHEGLFPLCTGCHQGIESGDRPSYYPVPSSCVGCHDGQELAAVEWEGPVARATNLAYDHLEHASAVSSAGDPALACAACHVPEGGGRMGVEPLSPEVCLACHGHPAESHFVDAECTTCHVPLASSALPRDRIEAIPEPEGHDLSGFLSDDHGTAAAESTDACTTCHTRDRCLSCHVNPQVPAILGMPVAPPAMDLPDAGAGYPVPPSHESPSFEVEHARLAGGPEMALDACGTCHTRDDCASCHLPPLPEAAGALLARSEVSAPGAQLVVVAPETHRRPFFLRNHSAAAAVDPQACATCHTELFCVECHQAPQRPAFHPMAFVSTHATDAWTRPAECANCHQVEVFCRDCHTQQGFGSRGRLGGVYHDAQSSWLLRHGQAARQGLESCSSCHTQRNCLQCHSELGAFGVNPHGPGFDARRAWERNPNTCFACHIRNPIGG